MHFPSPLLADNTGVGFMGLRLRYKKSLAAAFALVLALLAAIVVYISVSMTDVLRLHEYKMSYVAARDETLHEFYVQFQHLRASMREYHWALSTGFTSELLGHYANNALLSFNDLEEKSAIYMHSLSQDPLRIDMDVVEKRDLITQVMESVGLGFAEFARGGAYYVFDGAMDSAERLIWELRDVSAAARSFALSYIDSRLLAGERVVVALLTAFALLFAVLVYLSAKLIGGLMKGASLYREKVQLADEGRGAATDISEMVMEMVGTFSSLVNDINNVAKENAKGNQKARMDAESLFGIYAVAASAINSLLDIIDKERDMNKTRQLMFDAAPVVMTVFDKELNILECNEEALRRYGFKTKEGYGANFFSASPKHQPDGMLSVDKGRGLILRCFEDGYAHFEWVHQTLDGRPIPSDVICFPMKYNDADVMLSYAIDVSELKKSIEMAKEADERTKLMVDLEKERVKAAEENSRTKSRFLAKMSHEIRTPIAAVLGISEIQLKNKSLSPELDEAFAKIHNSASILLGIVNDILDLSKIEAGKMSLMEEKYELAGLISDVVQLNLAFLGSKQIDFLVEVDERLPHEMIGDALRIKQVLNNLLSNAFKYTSSGSVELKFIDETPDEDNLTHLKVVINDTGSGMTSEQLASLFDEYTRFGDEGYTAQEGTGLGMPITKNLLGLMGGTIDVSSSFGVGTRVAIQITQEAVGTKRIEPQAVKNIQEFRVDAVSLKKKMAFVPEPMPYGRVLVVDDVETNLYVARGLMQVYQLQIETCDSGYGAIEKVRDGEVYDIIFMDHMMPGIDGIETTSELRRLGYTKPIIALTANAIIGQAEEYIKRGFDGFISKPIQSTPLDAALTKYVKDRNFSDVEALGIDLSGFDDEPEEFVASDEMMAGIRADFVESQTGACEKILAAAEIGDFKTAYRLAHNLKNIAALLNDRHLVNAAEALEADLAAEKPGGGLMDALRQELNRALDDAGV